MTTHDVIEQQLAEFDKEFFSLLKTGTLHTNQLKPLLRSFAAAILKSVEEEAEGMNLVESEGYGFEPVLIIGGKNKKYPQHQIEMAKNISITREYGMGFNQALSDLRTRLAEIIKTVKKEEV